METEVSTQAEHIPNSHSVSLGLVMLARGALAGGHAVRARELAEQALAAAPGDAQVSALAAKVFSDGVPIWHFDLVRDQARNAAYDAALRRAVRPGMKVLEIGTGSGILAMMAARAGAAEVITCEANAAIAAAARENIIRSGYADRIRVLTKHSSEVDVEADMHGRADLLVSEIISNDILSQHVLPIMRHAVSELLAPRAPVIPLQAVARVCLAYSPAVETKRIGIVDGFDLAAFNRLAPPKWDVSIGDQQLELASEPADLFAFDFQSAEPRNAQVASVVVAASGTLANCVVQWFELLMDATGRYENRPRHGADSCWSALAYPLSRSVKLQIGRQVTVKGSCLDNSLQVWTDLP